MKKMAAVWCDPAPREEKTQEKAVTNRGPFALTWYETEVLSHTSQNCCACHNQENGCLVLTEGRSGAQCFGSVGEGEEASGSGEHSLPRATVGLVLSREVSDNTGAGGGRAEVEVLWAWGQAGSATSAEHHFQDKEGSTFFRDHIILNQLHCFSSYTCSN